MRQKADEYQKFLRTKIKVKKVIVYEEAPTGHHTHKHGPVKISELSINERKNFFRYGHPHGASGTDNNKEDQKIEVNLLEKYKPTIQLDEIREEAEKLDNKANLIERR